MKVLDSWLKKLVKYPYTPDDLSQRLAMLGIEVASIDRPGERYARFVVGEVLGVEKHPKADRLSVCKVNVGREQLQIVCGAPNVAAGQKVPVGLEGAVVPRNLHDPSGPPLTLARVTLRGVESAGMICSAKELDLGDDADGIMVLDPRAKVGEPLAKHLELDDVVYEVELTPNRSDCLSHIGIAREIGVMTGRAPKLAAVKLREGKERIESAFSVTVKDPVNCPRFAARMIRGVKIGPSPLWLQQTMHKVGLRPISNVVDATNYVMLELGQPLHAFDYARLQGGKIVVRQAGAGRKFRTLDGKERDLPAEAVMVCDGVREVSIAGIMGGENSEIGPETVDVVLEAAYWNPMSIRRTAKMLGMSTDASQRFERGADPNGVRAALDRAAALILETAGGTLLKGTIDRYPKKVREPLVPIRPVRVNEVLGTKLTPVEVKKSLGLLGMRVERSAGGKMMVRVPTYRVDIDREIDLIEEVARVSGYDRITPRTSSVVERSQQFPTVSPASALRPTLIGMGYQECLTNSMADDYRVGLAGVEPVKVVNPLGQEMAFMRTSLVPGLLDTVARNQNFGNIDLRLFEIGHVFSRQGEPRPELVENIIEEERVCLLLSGLAAPRYWSDPARPADVFDLKGEVEALLQRCGLDKARLIPYSTSNSLTDDSLAVEIQGTYAGYAGRIRKEVRVKFGIESEVFVAELRRAALDASKAKQYRQLPKFPKVKRDLAFVVPDGTPVGAMEETIRSAAGSLLESVELFDVYRGDNLPQGTKSVAFAIELLSRERTLTDSAVDACVASVVDAMGSLHGATLRGV